MAKVKDKIIKVEAKPVTMYTNDPSKSAEGFCLIRGANNSDFRNIRTPNISVRDSFTRTDYDFFRGDQELPKRPKDIMMACSQAYKRNAIVQNVINMMSDFSCKGIDIVHPSKSIQKFGKAWFKKVNGEERSERIGNMLLRMGTAPVKRKTKKVPISRMKALNVKASIKSPVDLDKNEIPTEYIILDPRTLEVLDGEFSPLMGKQFFRYGVRIPNQIGQYLDNVPEGDLLQPDTISSLSSMGLYGTKNKLVKIDPKYLEVLHYKKDDFQIWPTPILYALLDDIKTFDKLRLADRAALDGIISNVRLWRLGDIKERIFPGPEAVARLSDMLMQNVGGGAMDLVWGPELDFKESSSNAWQFLGNAKNISTLSNIYQGLGVPPTLTGIVGEAGQGFSNNFISLKVLIERLDYVRGVLKKFWEKELEIIQAVFGIRDAFQVTFDFPNLFEDSAQQKLLLEMADRNIISDELMQEKVGAIPEIESIRLKRENKAKDDGKMPEKVSPFIQQDPLGDTGGRPPGTKDAVKRKKKKVSPINVSSTMIWAEDTQNQLQEFLSEPFLKAKGKKNFRSLSSKDSETFEDLRFSILCSLEPNSKVSEDNITNVLANLKPIPTEIKLKYTKEVLKYTKANDGEEISISKKRQIQNMVYALNFVDKV